MSDAFPVNYIEARKALSDCDRIDECQMWANKAAAIESYARQARDESLKNLAARIQARAVRRCGELLKAVPENRVEFANAAGLTRLQRNQAIAVAQIPAKTFDAKVDSERPPRVYQLAQMGTKHRSLSRTNNARALDLRKEIKRLESKRFALVEKLNKTISQINQAKQDLVKLEVSAA